MVELSNGLCRRNFKCINTFLILKECFKATGIREGNFIIDTDAEAQLKDYVTEVIKFFNRPQTDFNIDRICLRRIATAFINADGY